MSPLPIPTFPEPSTGYDAANEAQFRREVQRVFQELGLYVQAADVTNTPSTLASGSTNDYVVGTETSILRLTPHASNSTLTGIVAPKGDRRLTIVNIGTTNLTLANESVSSSANNRFTVGGGADLVMAANKQAALIYDSISKRWRVNG